MALHVLTVSGRRRRKVQPDDEGPRIKFGAWVAISGDMVAVSAHNAPNPDHPATNRGHGTAAYVYNSVEDFGTPPFLAVEPFGIESDGVRSGQAHGTASKLPQSI